MQVTERVRETYAHAQTHTNTMWHPEKKKKKHMQGKVVLINGQNLKSLNYKQTDMQMLTLCM